LAAVPSIGRATRVEREGAPGADAASVLYERYSQQIFGYCLNQLGSREEAEDAVQTTFMNAFRGLQRGIVPELESAWLFKIAHNVCLSRRRSSWRRGRVESPNNFEVLQEVVPGREQVADELIRLQDVLEDMPENQRRAILLREWQGLTYREISTELGLSQAAVETLIFRARRALAQGLEQDADTWKKRLRRGADVGGAIACVKALLGGGGAAAIKVGTTAAVVATAAVAAATAPLAPNHPHAPAAKPIVQGHVGASKPRATFVATSSSTPRISRATATSAAIKKQRPSLSPKRTLPKPISAPATIPEQQTDASLAPPDPTPPPAEPPAPAADPPATPTSPPTTSPQPDRRPQSSTEPEPTPPPADSQQPQPAPEPKHEDKPDKPDHPDNGNGNGGGGGNGNGKAKGHDK
jgi:RNA polymerase sigma factor (sigma-70 family)